MATALAAPDQGVSTQVQVYVYDLSQGLARTLSLPLIGRQIDAVFHTSTVINNHEIFFGHGINVTPAGQTPFGRPIEILNIGPTQLDQDIRDALLVDLAERYTPDAYHLFENNCNTFTDEFINLLTGGNLPAHITGLPAEVLATPFGQSVIRPMMSVLEAQLVGMRRHAHHTLSQQHQQHLPPSTTSGVGVVSGTQTTTTAVPSGSGGGKEEQKGGGGQVIVEEDVIVRKTQGVLDDEDASVAVMPENDNVDGSNATTTSRVVKDATSTTSDNNNVRETQQQLNDLSINDTTGATGGGTGDSKNK